jgi:hypothetical protein
MASWPGLAQPSTSLAFQIQIVDARRAAGHHERLCASASDDLRDLAVTRVHDQKLAGDLREVIGLQR